MAITTIIGNPQPIEQAITFPYLASCPDSSGMLIAVWLVLDGGFGVVVGRKAATNNTGADFIQNTSTSTNVVIPDGDPYDITYLSSVFPLGYTEDNVSYRHILTPYAGSITIQNP